MMSDLNHEYDPEEQIVEIQDLDVERKQKNNATRKSLAAYSLVLSKRLSFEQRRKRIAVTSSLFLIGLLVLLVSMQSMWGVFSWLVPAQKTDATREQLFFFQTLPPWGSMTLDGHQLTQVPTLISQQPITLTKGFHVFVWHAEPFDTQQCILVVAPARGLQTCKTSIVGMNGYGRQATLINFPTAPSLLSMSVEQRLALIQDTQQFLDNLQATTVVQPGERYVYNLDQSVVRTAVTPLQVTHRFVLDTNTALPADCEGISLGVSCFVDGHDCRLFCTLNWPGVSNDVAGANADWHVAAIIRPIWQYTPLIQSSVAAAAEPLFVSGGQQYVTLRIRWQQGDWAISFHQQGASSFDDPNCITAMNTLVTQPSYQSLPSVGQQLYWSYLSGKNRADGCLAMTMQQVFVPNDANFSSQAMLLERFGVLLAANDAAHQLWPALPLATPLEQQVASNIAHQAVFVS